MTAGRAVKMIVVIKIRSDLSIPITELLCTGPRVVIRADVPFVSLSNLKSSRKSPRLVFSISEVAGVRVRRRDALSVWTLDSQVTRPLITRLEDSVHIGRRNRSGHRDRLL